MTDAAALVRDAFLRHGGRVAAAQALHPAAPRPWIDLSTGVNPHPYPAPRGDPRRLPDPESLAALEAAAARAFGADPAFVAATPGSEAAIRLLPRILGARSVAIAAPTYGGHAEAWSAAGARIVAAPGEADARIIVNPNNPDGAITPRAALLADGGWTIVDEAFADLDPGLSVAPAAGGRLVVLRSFGKFYGLPGLRLGFVVADPAVIATVRAALGEWPVGADAIAAGRAAYADDLWAGKTRARLARNANRLDQVLTAGGLTVLGGTSLFRLTRCDDAAGRFSHLLRAGLLCRPLHDPTLLRFGLPGAPAAWARLQAALGGPHVR